MRPILIALLAAVPCLTSPAAAEAASRDSLRAVSQKQAVERLATPSKPRRAAMGLPTLPGIAETLLGNCNHKGHVDADGVYTPTAMDCSNDPTGPID